MQTEEPNAAPRLRFHLDGGECVAVANLDTGETFHGAAAQSAYAAKCGLDRIALSALEVIVSHMPDYVERRLDVSGTVIFGLPADRAADLGAIIAYDLVGTLLDEVAEGRLAVVWADG